MAGQLDRSVFLERRNYRRRRMLDAAKLLPIVGAWLFMLPLLWQNDGTTGTQSLSYAWTYIFVMWLALTILGAALALAIGRASASDNSGEEEI